MNCSPHCLGPTALARRLNVRDRRMVESRSSCCPLCGDPTVPQRTAIARPGSIGGTMLLHVPSDTGPAKYRPVKPADFPPFRGALETKAPRSEFYSTSSGRFNHGPCSSDNSLVSSNGSAVTYSHCQRTLGNTWQDGTPLDSALRLQISLIHPGGSYRLYCQ